MDDGVLSEDAVYGAFYHGEWMAGRRRVTWQGVAVLQCPTDLMTYAMLLQRLRPALVIETGTAAGGCALFLADQCRLLGRGHVVSIDHWQDAPRPQHPRLQYVVKDSLAASTLRLMQSLVAKHGGPVLVLLDSAHDEDHVWRELCVYAPLVTVGSYCIVEDTNTEGPRRAVARWLEAPTAGQWLADPREERFGLTFHPGGFLLRCA